MGFTGFYGMTPFFMLVVHEILWDDYPHNLSSAPWLAGKSLNGGYGPFSSKPCLITVG